MIVPKRGAGSFHIKTIARQELADDLLALLVDRVCFFFHLPYLLDANLSSLGPARGPDGATNQLTFSKSEKRVIFPDGHEVKTPCTLAKVTVWWEDGVPTLRAAMARPLAVLMEYPLYLINGLLQAYQLVSHNYDVKHLGIFDLDYVPGEVWLRSKAEPLQMITHHERPSSGIEVNQDELLYYSAAFLSGEPNWLATSLFVSARRAASEGDWKRVFIDSVTCIEVLAAAVQSRRERVDNRQGGLRRQLGDIGHHPAVSAQRDQYARLVSTWLSQVYAVRNRVVHTGQEQDSPGEVQAALTLTGSLSRMLDGLLHPRSEVHPSP